MWIVRLIVIILERIPIRIITQRWEKDGFVYVILGDEPCLNKFEVWYRVKKDDYVKAWEEILARYQ